MPKPVPVLNSIRSGLIGALHDFVREAGFGTAIDLTIDLVYELADYREEDVEYFPSVYILMPLEQSDAFSIIAPGADRIRLGEIAASEHCGQAVLKNCAALADDGWSIFVEIGGERVLYGVFRSESLPTSLSSADLLADPGTKSGVALLIRNCAKNCVELVAGAGKSLEIALTSAKPATQAVSNAFANLANAITSDVDADERTQVSDYFRRLLFKLTQQCHGTILVVVPSSKDFPLSLRDGVVLIQSIDFVSAIIEIRENSAADTCAKLISQEAILKGMIQSDGITVLSSDGKILAFRVFVKPDESERMALDELDIRGGARTRAHELLKLRVGSQLNCVFFKSQDGSTCCTVRP